MIKNKEIYYILKNEFLYSKFKHFNVKYEPFYNKYKDIIDSNNFLRETINIQEKIYCFIKNINRRDVCEYCKKDAVKFYDFKRGYTNYCSNISCIKKASQDKKIKTCFENFGVSNPSQSKIIQDKKVKTSIDRYGVKYPNQSKVVKEKRTKTNLKKYGVENVFQSKEIKQKIKSVIVERYGVENPSHSDEFKQKRMNTCRIKYGVDNPNQSEVVKLKSKQTSLLKYKTEHPTQSKSVQLKKINTNIKRYGYKSPMQNPEIFEKQQKSSFKKELYPLPSGKQIMLQGYESFGLNILLYEMNYNEEDILTGPSQQPELWYDFEEARHRYYCDIFIPKDNKLIEIKSTYYFSLQKERNLLKQKASRDLGFIHEIWIIDKEKLVEIV